MIWPFKRKKEVKSSTVEPTPRRAGTGLPPPPRPVVQPSRQQGKTFAASTPTRPEPTRRDDTTSNPMDPMNPVGFYAPPLYVPATESRSHSNECRSEPSHSSHHASPASHDTHSHHSSSSSDSWGCGGGSDPSPASSSMD